MPRAHWLEGILLTALFWVAPERVSAVASSREASVRCSVWFISSTRLEGKWQHQDWLLRLVWCYCFNFSFLPCCLRVESKPQVQVLRKQPGGLSSVGAKGYVKNLCSDLCCSWPSNDECLWVSSRHRCWCAEPSLTSCCSHGQTSQRMSNSGLCALWTMPASSLHSLGTIATWNPMLLPLRGRCHWMTVSGP